MSLVLCQSAVLLNAIESHSTVPSNLQEQVCVHPYMCIVAQITFPYSLFPNRQVIVRCIAPYICWLLDLLVGKVHPTLLCNSSQIATEEHPERVVLAINHGRNILQFDIRCKLAEEMQPMLCMIRFIAEVEMIYYQALPLCTGSWISMSIQCHVPFSIQSNYFYFCNMMHGCDSCWPLPLYLSCFNQINR